MRLKSLFSRLAEKLTAGSGEAYRADVAAAINNRMRKDHQPLWADLLTLTDREGAILSSVPEENIEDVARRLETAGRAYETEQQVLFGSQTAPQQAAASQIGTRMSAEDMLRMSQLDPLAIMQQAGRIISQAAPQLSERERMQVVNVLMSEEPLTCSQKSL